MGSEREREKKDACAGRAPWTNIKYRLRARARVSAPLRRWQSVSMCSALFPYFFGVRVAEQVRKRYEIPEQQRENSISLSFSPFPSLYSNISENSLAFREVPKGPARCGVWVGLINNLIN